MAPLQHIMCLHLPLRAATTKRTMDGAITQLSFVYVRGQQLISPQQTAQRQSQHISSCLTRGILTQNIGFLGVRTQPLAPRFKANR